MTNIHIITIAAGFTALGYCLAWLILPAFMATAHLTGAALLWVAR